MSGRSSTVPAIVLSSRVWRDQDRMVSVLTPEHGKVRLIAKGVRKLTSQRKAALQPGSRVRCAWTQFGERRILTEALLDRGTAECAFSLERLRDISAILEILSTIALEEIEQEDLFYQAEGLLNYVCQSPEIHRGVVRQKLLELLQSQGIEVSPEEASNSVIDTIERALGKKLHSFEYFAV